MALLSVCTATVASVLLPTVDHAPLGRGVLLGAALLLFGSTGCTSVNHYATPRLLAPGEISVAAAVEATQLVRTRDIPSFGDVRTTTTSLALYPALMARRGVSERLELGFNLRPSGLGGEIKVGVWDGRDGGRAALLLAPSIQAGAAIMDAPVLVGMRVQERVEVFASPGIAASRGLIDNRVAPSGLLARAGIGASVRIAGDLRVVPEMTVATGIVGDTTQWMTGGIGLAGEIGR